MPESSAAIIEYWSAAEGTAAAAGGAAEAAGVVGATAGSGAGAGFGAAAASGGGSSLLGTLGSAAATAAVTAGVTKALAPGLPDPTKPLPMPDPAAQEEARKRKLVELMSRRGRASTVLTDPGDKLGG